MRKMLAALIMLILFVAFTVVSADATEIDTELFKNGETESLTDALPPTAEDILQGVSPTDTENGQKGLAQVLLNFKEHLADEAKSALKSAAAVLAIALLTAAVGFFFDGSVPDYTVMTGVLAMTAVAAGGVKSLLSLTSSVISELSIFSKALLPAMTTAATAAGATISAPIKYAATSLFMDVLLTIGERFVLPLIYCYTAVGVGASALGNDGLASAAKLVKWVATTTLAALVTAFTVYLTVSGVIASSADATATRLVKTGLSAVLPVVGGIISDAASVVVSGFSVLRGTIGVFGLVSVLAIVAVPFLRLVSHMLAYKAASALIACFSDSRLTKAAGAIGDSFAMALGLAGSSALMLFISVISVIKAVTVV